MNQTHSLRQLWGFRGSLQKDIFTTAIYATSPGTELTIEQLERNKESMLAVRVIKPLEERVKRIEVEFAAILEIQKMPDFKLAFLSHQGPFDAVEKYLTAVLSFFGATIARSKLESQYQHVIAQVKMKTGDLQARINEYKTLLRDCNPIFELERKYVKRRHNLPLEMQRVVDTHFIRAYDNEFTRPSVLASLTNALKWPTERKKMNLQECLSRIETDERMLSLCTEERRNVREIVTKIVNSSQEQSSELMNVFHFYGPQGTGKTRTVRMIAESLQLPFIDKTLMRDFARLSQVAVEGQNSLRTDGFIGWFIEVFFREAEDEKSYLNPILLLDEVDIDNPMYLDFFKYYLSKRTIDVPYFHDTVSCPLDITGYNVFITSNYPIGRGSSSSSLRGEALLPIYSRIFASYSFPERGLNQGKMNFLCRRISDFLSQNGFELFGDEQTQEFVFFAKFMIQERKKLGDLSFPGGDRDLPKMIDKLLISLQLSSHVNDSESRDVIKGYRRNKKKCEEYKRTHPDFFELSDDDEPSDSSSEDSDDESGRDGLLVKIKTEREERSSTNNPHVSGPALVSIAANNFLERLDNDHNKTERIWAQIMAQPHDRREE